MAREFWNFDSCYTLIDSFIHSVICLTTGPMPPPKRCLHIMRSRASSLKWEHPLLSLRSSSSFWRLLPRLLATSISPFIFPSITCFRRQFLRKMCPIQLAFRFLISCRIFLCSLTLSNTSSYPFHDRTPKTFPENRGNGITNGELFLSLTLSSVQFKGECGVSCGETRVHFEIRGFTTTDHLRGDTL